MLHCCEAPRSMLSNYFCKKQVLRGTFGEIWRIQIQIYPKTYVDLKYGACYLNNKVSAHRLGSVVQLSWRVAPPSCKINVLDLYINFAHFRAKCLSSAPSLWCFKRKLKCTFPHCAERSPGECMWEGRWGGDWSHPLYYFLKYLRCYKQLKSMACFAKIPSCPAKEWNCWMSFLLALNLKGVSSCQN